MIKFTSPLFLFGISIVVIIPVASIIFAEVCTTVMVPVDPPQCEPNKSLLSEVGDLCMTGTVVEYYSSRYETVILGEKIVILDDSRKSKIGSYEDIFSDKNPLFHLRD